MQKHKDKAYSFYDIATALTELSDKEVNYTNVETAAFKETMKLFDRRNY